MSNVDFIKSDHSNQLLLIHLIYYKFKSDELMPKLQIVCPIFDL